MAWKGGFLGQSYTREEFRKYLRTQKRPSYPQFFVAHNTAAPYIVPTVAIAQRIKNLGHYYKTLKWNTGPNLFAIGDKVWLGTPLQFPGTNSPSFNGKSIGIEVEGDYRKGKHDPKEGKGLVNWTTAAWVFAELLEWYGYPLDDAHIKLHKEDPKTTHDCPGNLVTKPWLLGLIRMAQGKSTEAPAHTAKDEGLVYYVNVPPKEFLNTRSGPSTKHDITGGLPAGTRVTAVAQMGKWREVRTPGGFHVWVHGDYLVSLAPVPPVAPKAPAPVPPTPETPKPVSEAPSEPQVTQSAGNYKWSEDWCLPVMKSIEGLRLKAYVDKPGWSIGYGHCSTSGIPPVPYEGMTCTKAEAEDMLRADLNECIRYMKAWVKVPLTQYQVDALCVHMFQQGPTQFRKNLVSVINTKEHGAVAATISNMPHAKPGVVRRRLFEAKRYLGSTSMKW